MPLLDEQKAAICRITSAAAGKVKRGTGFLIGPGRVLTAFHVVGDRAQKSLAAGPFRLEFGPRSEKQKPFVSQATKILESNWSDDWAILVPDHDPPPPTAALGVARVPRGYIINWATWGFPDVDPDWGRAYDGTIAATGAEMQLFTPQALEKEASRVAGLSGSPCIVDGRAVGIIIAASDPKEAGYTTGGALFAVPMQTVASTSREVQMPPEGQLPFVSEVADYLSSPQSLRRLTKIANTLGLPQNIAPERLPDEVATAILRGGLEKTTENVLALGGVLDRTKALEILDCAGSLWIDAGATSLLEKAVTGANYPLVGLNVAAVEAANRYLHRAGYQKVSHPGWRHAGEPLPPPQGEQQLRGLIDGVKEILRKKLAVADDKILEELQKQTWPVFIVIPPPIPEPRNLQRLKKAFKRVNFITLLGTQISESTRTCLSGMTFILPMLADGIEAAAHDDYRRKLIEVTNFYDSQIGARG